MKGKKEKREKEKEKKEKERKGKEEIFNILGGWVKGRKLPVFQAKD